MTLATGVVNLTGDTDHNDISVVRQGDVVRITGNQTTLNSLNQPIEFPAAAVSSIRAILDAGNDSLAIDGALSLAETLRFDGHTGDDTLVIGGDVTARNAILNLGWGDDQITIRNLEVSRNTAITAEGLTNIDISGSTFRGGLQIVGGQDQDIITFGQTQVAREFDLSTRNGNDQISLHGVESQSSLKVSTGEDNDTLTIVNSHLWVNSRITMLGGNDSVQIVRTESTGKFSLATGSGNDQVGLSDVSFDRFSASLGSGQDIFLSSGSIHDRSPGNRYNGLFTLHTQEDADVVVFEGTHLFGQSAILEGDNRDKLVNEGIPHDAQFRVLGPTTRPLSSSQTRRVDALREILTELNQTPFTLTTDVEVVMAGTPEQIQLQATLGEAIGDERVRVYEGDANGNKGTFLVELFDDGLAIHGDAIAGDGIFNNTLAIQINDANSIATFIAEAVSASAPGAAQVATAQIQAIAAPSEETMLERIEFSNAINAALQNLINAGTPIATAVNAIAAQLRANATVMPGSVEVTGRSVFWRSIEGILFAAFGDNPGDDQRANSSTPVISASNTASGTVGAVTAEEDEEVCGQALVLGVYAWQFEPWDESNEIAGMLDDAGYEVTALYNSAQTSQNISVEDFKNMREYETVVITSHGDSSDRYGTLLLTGDQTSLDDLDVYFADIISGRLAFSGDTFAITPRFVTRYAGSLNDTIVYVGSCRSTFNDTLANAFLGRGAAAFVGYSDYVGSGFANTHGIDLFETLLNDEEIGNAPGIDVDQETDSDPARFDLRGDNTAKLQKDCLLLNDWDLYVEYKWPLSQRDLDTSTRFLSGSVGYACPGGSYLNWSGDNTSAGGTETVIVDLDSAFDAGLWDGVVNVSLYAGWYIPAGGSGPSTLTVGLRNQSTGEFREVESRTISPGRQNDCADTLVGVVLAKVTGEGDDAVVSYELA